VTTIERIRRDALKRYRVEPSHEWLAEIARIKSIVHDAAADLCWPYEIDIDDAELFRVEDELITLFRCMK
jgi:hypothetical protein